MSKYTITTVQDNTGVAPASDRWHAYFGDYDDGVRCGTGATEADAIEDLIDNNDVPWGAA